MSQPPEPPPSWSTPDPSAPPAYPYPPQPPGTVLPQQFQQPYQQPYQQQYASGAQPYAGGPNPSWSAPFKDVSALGLAVIVLSSLAVLGDLLTAATSFSAVDAYREAAARGDEAVFTAHDLLGLVGLLQVANFIVTALWLTGARDNAVRLAPQAVRRRAVWCWLGWIVPIVTLWFPKQMVDDVWRGTASSLPPGSPDRRDPHRPVPTTLWWALWLVYAGLGNAAGRLSISGDGTDGGIVPALDFAVAIAGVAALICWIQVVRSVSRVQRQVAAGPVAGSYPQPF